MSDPSRNGTPGGVGRGAYALLFSHAALVQLVSYGMRAAIAYEMLALGKNGAWLGYMAAAFALPPLLLALPSGRLVQRFGERVSMVIGAVAFLASLVVARTFETSAVGLLVSSALLGCGLLFSVVGEQSWVMKVASSKRLDFAFGMYTLATSVGQMLGPLVLLIPAGSLLAVAGLERAAGSTAASDGPDMAAITLLCGIVSLALLIISWCMASRGSGKRTSRKEGGSVVSLLRQPGVPSALFASSIVLTSLDLAIVYLPLLAEDRGIPAFWVSIMLTARGAATMLSRLTLSLTTRHFGRRNVLVAGGMLAGAALLVFVIPLPPLALLAACIVYGLAAGTVQPLTMSWMTLITTPEQRSMTASLRLLGNRVGQTSIPFLVSGISALGGAAAVFAVMGGGLLISGLMSKSAPNE